MGMTPIVLAIAGADPSAGAGIQADLKTLSALGVYGVTVITALTAQNTQEVGDIFPVPAAFVAKQLDTLTRDITVHAVKIGMTAQADIIETICHWLEAHPDLPVVFDPVMRASAGGSLMTEPALTTLRQRLLPRVSLLTPNLEEAARLLDGSPALTETEMGAQAEALCDLGPKAVLITGGHLPGDQAVDILVEKIREKGEEGRLHRFGGPKIPSRHGHGTGCTLSSAIAAGLAQGLPLPDAIATAKAYVTQALQAADKLAIGHGPGPLAHFFAPRPWPVEGKSKSHKPPPSSSQ